MIRSLFLTTALIGIAGSAMAEGHTHIGGSYAPAPGTVTLGGDYMGMSVEHDGAHAAPQTITHGAGAASHHTQTIDMTSGSSQTFSVPAGQNATYNIVVPSAAPAQSVSYAPQAQPIYAPSHAGAGWAAKGVYVGARAGLTSQRDNDFSVIGRKGRLDINTAYKEPGYTGALVVGYGARNKQGWGYRVELEGGYQHAEVDSHRIRSTRGVREFSGDHAFGDSKVLYGFVNTYGDLALTDRLSLTAGGGVGVGRVSFDNYGISGDGNQVLDDSANAFGYHLGAGMSYQVTDKVAVEAMYRYQQFIDAKVKTTQGNEEKIDLESHGILAGVRLGL